jgi:metal-responsive CopG/Arc/MetJ family transcriptional regulator
MPGVKTAISLDENLFKKVNEIAHDLHVSRSRVFTLAVIDFLKKQENISLLTQLNEAYGDQPTMEENKILNSMRKTQKKMSEREIW